MSLYTPIYFWIDNKVVIHEPSFIYASHNRDLFPSEIHMAMCIDTNFMGSSSSGFYNLNRHEKFWNYVPIDSVEFPKEFLLALALLGITHEKRED